MILKQTKIDDYDISYCFDPNQNIFTLETFCDKYKIDKSIIQKNQEKLKFIFKNHRTFFYFLSHNNINFETITKDEVDKFLRKNYLEFFEQKKQLLFENISNVQKKIELNVKISSENENRISFDLKFLKFLKKFEMISGFFYTHEIKNKIFANKNLELINENLDTNKFANILKKHCFNIEDVNIKEKEIYYCFNESCYYFYFRFSDNNFSTVFYFKLTDQKYYVNFNVWKYKLCDDLTFIAVPETNLKLDEKLNQLLIDNK